MLGRIKEFIDNHMDFNVYTVTWLAIIVLIAGIPCILFAPEKYGYENGLFENLQLIALFIGFVMALMAKVNKKFFKFVAMVIVILMLREVNCGRTIFFPVPDTVNEFYRWKDIKYGYLAHPLYGLYMSVVGFYFLKNKLFINLWNYVKKIKFPVWNMILMVVGMSFGMYAEKTMHNMVFEEVTELLFYVALVGVVYLYAYNKDFQLKED